MKEAKVEPVIKRVVVEEGDEVMMSPSWLVEMATIASLGMVRAGRRMKRYRSARRAYTDLMDLPPFLTATRRTALNS